MKPQHSLPQNMSLYSCNSFIALAGAFELTTPTVTT